MKVLRVYHRRFGDGNAENYLIASETSLTCRVVYVKKRCEWIAFRNKSVSYLTRIAFIAILGMDMKYLFSNKIKKKNAMKLLVFVLLLAAAEAKKSWNKLGRLWKMISVTFWMYTSVGCSLVRTRRPQRCMECDSRHIHARHHQVNVESNARPNNKLLIKRQRITLLW